MSSKHATKQSLSTFLNGDLKKRVLYFRVFKGKGEAIIFCENTAYAAVSLYNTKQCLKVKGQVELCGPTINVSLEQFRLTFQDLGKRSDLRKMEKFIIHNGLVYTFLCKN